MSEAISSVVKFVFGLISNKVRAYGAEKLQDGGLTDQKFRGWIVRELDDIKFKLDANARKDLSASISSLKQGVQRLQISFGESSESVNPSTSELPKDGKKSQETANAGASSTETKPAQQTATVEDAVALANAIGKLKIESKERFELAKESFKEAGKKASEAFHNAALSTNERILASKVRIASGILGNLDDLEVAASDCLQYLQELHDMPSIQEIFSVHVQGGIKSLFKKESRAEIVESITMINLILADFISKCTKRRMAVFDWPMIECSKQVVHPIHYDLLKGVGKMEEMGITPPWDIVRYYSHKSFERLQDVAINSKGDIIGVFDGDNHLRELVYRGTVDEWQPHCLSSPDDKTRYDTSIAIDEDDMVYVVSKYDSAHTLSVSDGKNINRCPLDFIQKGLFQRITVTKDKNIVICSFKSNGYRTGTLYICDINGKLIKSFPIHLKSANETVYGIFVFYDNSTRNEITIATKKQPYSHIQFLYVYTQEGELKRAITLPQPSSVLIYSITFDCDKRNHIVCSVNNDRQMHIQCISEFGELRNSIFLDAKDIFDYGGRLIAHPNGAIAMLNSKCVLYLRSSLM